MQAGEYSIPFQRISVVLLGPGSTVSHDALRLLARHGTGLLAVGEGGVRLYASMPFGPDDSALARRQAKTWAQGAEARVHVARQMYAWRMGELFPNADIAVLRGMEGARMKESYTRLAEQYGIHWAGRRYDRQAPEKNDIPNQALNHAATALEAAAMVAVASVGALPQLGFVHEDSGVSFCLDIADLYRSSVTVPVAFGAAREHLRSRDKPLEGLVRRLAGQTLQKQGIIPGMIDRIKELFDAHDCDRDA